MAAFKAVRTASSDLLQASAEHLRELVIDVRYEWLSYSDCVYYTVLWKICQLELLPIFRVENCIFCTQNKKDNLIYLYIIRWLFYSDNTPYEKIGDEVRSLADEIPFDIPDSWEWVRFGNIVANYDSKRRPVTKEQRKNEHGYYDYYGATGAIDRVDDYIFEGEYLMIGEDGGNFFTERDNAFIASGRFWAKIGRASCRERG